MKERRDNIKNHKAGYLQLVQKKSLLKLLHCSLMGNVVLHQLK